MVPLSLLIFPAEIELDPRGKRVDERAEEIAGAVVVEIPGLVEQFARSSHVRFRLLHRRDVEENEHLPKVMIRAKPWPISMNSNLSEDGASFTIAFATLRVNESLRRLPTRTPTFRTGGMPKK